MRNEGAWKLNYGQIFTIDSFGYFPNGNAALLQKSQTIGVDFIFKSIDIGFINLTAQKGNDIRGKVVTGDIARGNRVDQFGRR